jgi:hypothetical protein
VTLFLKGVTFFYFDVREPPEPEPPEPDAAPPAPPPPEPVAGAEPVPTKPVSERLESGVVEGELFIGSLVAPEFIVSDKLSGAEGETDVESASRSEEVSELLQDTIQKVITAMRVTDFISVIFRCKGKKEIKIEFSEWVI